jgi:nickel transport protein
VTLPRAALLAFALGWTSPAVAHEVLHSVERGRAIAVKAFFADGEPLAYSEYVVFSPTDPKIPYQKGRTDRAGYLAFVPDCPGHWHVKVSTTDGHGLELDVAAEADDKKPAATGGIASWAFAVRPLVGVLLIAGLFVALTKLYRRKRP